jgi:integrase
MALTVKVVDALMRQGDRGRHHDGGGLYLVVVSARAAHWERRYERHGQQHYLGLGSARVFSLVEARGRNRQISQQLADGVDPLAAKRAARATAVTRLTFREASEQFMAQRDAGWSSAKHIQDWKSSLRRFAWPILGTLDVAEIGVPHVLKVLEQPVGTGQFWTAKSVTADRLRNRIELILGWAEARGHRPRGVNPAAWKGGLQHVLPAPAAVARVVHHKALPYTDIPTLLAQLEQRTDIAVRALVFTVLTAARAGDVLGARWDEIDNKNAMWVIPATRMKSRREHKVPLAPQVLTLLRTLPRMDGNPYLFVGARSGRAVGESAMGATLRRLGCSATVHGFRSSFSDWAHERTAHSNYTIEISLAHTVGSEVERGYRRGDMFEKRRQLMAQWATFCTTSPPTSEVVSLRRS